MSRLPPIKNLDEAKAYIDSITPEEAHRIASSAKQSVLVSSIGARALIEAARSGHGDDILFDIYHITNKLYRSAILWEHIELLLKRSEETRSPIEIGLLALHKVSTDLFNESIDHFHNITEPHFPKGPKK